MDATQIFRQGLGTVAPRQQTFDQFHGHGIDDDDFLDGDSSGQRVAHTLTACCRCRQVINALYILLPGVFASRC